jgi:hypothetical protein
MTIKPKMTLNTIAQKIGIFLMLKLGKYKREKINLQRHYVL